MEEIKNYKSRDGENFSDPLLCARYEIESFPDILESIQEQMKEKPLSHQKNWCGYNSIGASACACMGCINHKFHEANLTKYHWKVWFDNYRPKENYDENKDSFGIVINKIQENKSNVMKLLREIFKMPVPEIAKIIKQDSYLIMTHMSYYETTYYFKKAKQYNPELDLEMFYEKPENVLNQNFIIPINKGKQIKP